LINLFGNLDRRRQITGQSRFVKAILQLLMMHAIPLCSCGQVLLGRQVVRFRVDAFIVGQDAVVAEIDRMA
jgi:hypothetical protein